MGIGPTTVYPFSSVVAEGYGTPKTYTVTNPAAGADWTRTVPGEGSWLVQAIKFTFTASGVAGTRQILLRYSDGNNTIVELATTPGVGAGTTNATITGFIGAGGIIAPGQNRGFTFPLPAIMLDPGAVISTNTVSIDVGDQFASITLRVIELPWGPTGYPRGPAYQDQPDYVSGG